MRAASNPNQCGLHPAVELTHEVEHHLTPSWGGSALGVVCSSSNDGACSAVKQDITRKRMMNEAYKHPVLMKPSRQA